MGVTTTKGDGQGGSKRKSSPPPKPLKKTFQEIKEHDEKSWDIFKGSGLPIRPGSICKVRNTSQDNWGVKVTEDNKEWIKERAESFYKKDITEAEEKGKSVDLKGLKIQPYSHYIQSGIRIIGKIVKEVVRKLEKKKRKDSLIKTAVIGGRSGTLAVPIVFEINDLDDKLVERTQFYIVEPSQSRLEIAERTLPMYGIEEIRKTKAGGFSLEHKTDEQFLSTQKDNEVDIMISFFHCHNKPFSDHVPEMKRVLKKNGTLILLDNYSPMWQNPVFVHELLREIGAGDKILADFKAYFNVNCKNRPALEKVEAEALKDHKDYWMKVVREIREGGYETEKPIFFLKAHSTVAQRLERLHDSGFSTETERILELYPNLFDNLDYLNPVYRLKEKSDIVTLILAVKEG